ncbi:glutathione synthetase-like [Diprion similis]|uniref:glutathione synthetase-like n=1 Tax=Diprion similis TaxID=362088 RepID=UPI001EF86AD2|nr:glutathione synthetase-like [Diprion similis]
MNASDQPSMGLCVKLPLPQAELQELIDKAKDWSLMNGACMRSKKNFNRDTLQFAPFILIPSSFPRTEFNRACEIQIILNELMHRVAHDYEFLKETLKETIKVDTFTRKLFDIYETVYSGGFTQKISLGMLRSDLMLDTSCPKERGCSQNHKPYCCWKQVEINTIASGFGWLGPAATKLHKYVLQELDRTSELENLPDNNALQGLCTGMIDAWNIYNDPKSVILFIIEDVTYNICDQRFHEFEIRRLNPCIRVLRRTLTELAVEARLSPKKELIVGEQTVAVVYFRCGYEPSQYPSEKEWDVRLLIERSLAIKSPSIQYHLAGAKKVQQALAKPGVLARFLKDEGTAEQIRGIFTGLYALDFDEHGENAIDMGIANPERFVLKPQREGGGNNIYGNEIKTALESMKDKQERSAWILMDRIQPPLQRNYQIRAGSNTDAELKEVVSELGIFGILIGDEKNIIINRQVGHMLRTKLASADEGGVASGLGACDSPYLTD